MKNMGLSVESELKSLLAYYGETASGPDAIKPEDFFGLILSFSSSLQVTSSFATLIMEVTNFLCLRNLQSRFMKWRSLIHKRLRLR